MAGNAACFGRTPFGVRSFSTKTVNASLCRRCTLGRCLHECSVNQVSWHVPLIETHNIGTTVLSVNREMNEEIDFPYIILDLTYVIARKSPDEYRSLNWD